ncbi:MAG: Phosphoribosylaminoimidazolecarboxamide formyltransferase [Thermodesulfobacterium commune]|jgi:phosphoribosylaminoimidazolecarboxamide formyltransferase/IMP cyclohydrolase|uniref:IMP cyclohydrolase n=1 Tax=Thermodesulfobacterium commune TaxID=1741 RepID=A0A101FKF5_9BACT|nr:MAG: Phosphoribosylaminoimidazolecarboxamide formyltransferase [Thermodesulfobacterium commune]MDK2861033.1 phosphoribosylaminoimidazolecarboxamide formyltransferase / cyclohydrolase [Thermodesulfobacterium sp.]KUK38662.1 MAG: Phosphoribosylaminoimidazolecarboxamide formyltransferase [Thermodesulfobacterium commune]HAA84604.1 IMP cyclohydrolase [Thermodesulfobacterium commune]HBT03802.1 IMP cyclohydrolase [Thermodesulfobacterium commune]
MNKIERALISVTDKKGVVELAKELESLGIEIISTGGTAKVLREAGVKVVEISEVTGFPEILEGRVKTLHPHIHGGILFKRDNPEHVETIKKLQIKPIDLVVVNLYAFEKVVEKGGDLEEAIENIDIGGPTLLRASAKNFKYVTVVIDPEDYEKVLEEIRTYGNTTLKTRFELAKKVFALTSRYDRTILDYLSRFSV